MTKTDHARRRKTPRQRAEETLGLAKRKHDRLAREVVVRRAELAAAESDLAAAKARLEYARQDPALQEGTSTTRTPNQEGATA